MTELPFDIAAFRESFYQGDAESDQAVEAELFTLFLETLTRVTTNLPALLAEDEKWAQTAHELAGAAGNLTAMNLRYLCKDAEATPASDQDARRDALVKIAEEGKRVRHYIDEIQKA